MQKCKKKKNAKSRPPKTHLSVTLGFPLVYHGMGSYESKIAGPCVGAQLVRTRTSKVLFSSNPLNHGGGVSGHRQKAIVRWTILYGQFRAPVWRLEGPLVSLLKTKFTDFLIFVLIFKLNLGVFGGFWGCCEVGHFVMSDELGILAKFGL